jgi:hypothetical protein
VCANTGWPFETVLDQMSFDRFQALQAEWERRPPAHWLIAKFLGYEAPERKEYMTPEAARAWMEATGGRIEGVAQRG